MISIFYGFLIVYLFELHSSINKTKKELAITQYHCDVASYADSEHQYLLDELSKRNKGE